MVWKYDRQINRDCEFLEAERIMDYSLLVGLHFRDKNRCDKMGLSPFLLRSGKDYDLHNVVMCKIFAGGFDKLKTTCVLSCRL